MSVTQPGATTPPPPPITPVVLAQRYRLDRRLAQGGMAEVWVATDLSLSRQVAVKVLKASLAADPIIAERFRREAIAVAQLSHPNIVAVYDAIEDGGRQAVVMQLVNGKSLRQLLDEQKRLSPDLTIHIGTYIAAALDAAHRAGMVHRDVKPGNILLTPDGRVLLADFGIAKGLASVDDDLTCDNVMMGTAKYLSPEQVRGKKLDGRADLYSLGLVLYECLAGRVPFLGETDADTALARLNRDPTDITRLRATLPYGLAPLVHRLLARKPEQRFATGAEVRAELTRVASRVDDPTLGFTPPAGSNTPTGPVARAAGSPASTATPPLGNYQPVRTAGRVAGPAVRADRTPPNALRPQQRPNRQFETSRRSSLIVIGLLLGALIVGGVLWATSNDRSSGAAAPAITAAVPSTTEAPAALPPTGPGAIVAVTTFDPEGTDKTENDQYTALATDGKAGTAWPTLCYGDKYLGGKAGVGLIADLGAATSGTLTAAIASAPYQVQVFTSGAETAPTAVTGWGAAIDKANADTAGTISVRISSARFVLVMFNELGKDGGCSKNPYRGKISELAFTPG